jgi:hypothetical protein
MLKYFILFLNLIGVICVISKFRGYYKFINISKSNAYNMYKNKYIKNKIYDIFLIVSFFVVIILTILFLDL